jgi:hypothetical protein
MDVNYKLGLGAKEFERIKSAAALMGIRYAGVAGGEANPHHKFIHPNHESPWIFVVDSAWREHRHVRFQKRYTAALQDFGSQQEENSGRNVSIPDENFESALEYACRSGPSEKERETQRRIVKEWAHLFGDQYELVGEWVTCSAGVPDLIAVCGPDRSVVVIELKVVHTGKEVLAQLQRYSADPKIASTGGGQPPLGVVIAPSYQDSLLLSRPSVRLYRLSVEPLGVQLIHDGWLRPSL